MDEKQKQKLNIDNQTKICLSRPIDVNYPGLSERHNIISTKYSPCFLNIYYFFHTTIVCNIIIYIVAIARGSS